MQEGFGFINKDHSRIASYHFTNDSGKSLNTVACLIDDLSGCVKPHCVCVDTALLHIVTWSSIREANSKLPKSSRIQGEVASKCLKQDTSNLVSLSILSKKNLEAALGWTLKVSRALFLHQSYTASSI